MNWDVWDRGIKRSTAIVGWILMAVGGVLAAEALNRANLLLFIGSLICLFVALGVIPVLFSEPMEGKK